MLYKYTHTHIPITRLLHKIVFTVYRRLTNKYNKHETGLSRQRDMAILGNRYCMPKNIITIFVVVNHSLSNIEKW